MTRASGLSGRPFRRPALPFAAALAAASLLALQGCEETGKGVVDTSGRAPFVLSSAVAPPAVNLDTLPLNNGTATVTAVVSARLADPDGREDVDRVTASVWRPSATSPFASVALVDNGVTPDAAAGDSVYTGTLRFTATRAEAGEYRIDVQGFDRTGFASNGVLQALTLVRNNARPSLDSASLIAPDTVTIPSGGSVLVLMAIAASDSDGIADIRRVYFTNLVSANPNLPFELQDDGGANPPLYFAGVRSGDVRAGDGVYSIQIPLVDGQAQRRTNRFSFKAVDSFGAVSDSLVHLLTVR